MTTTTNSETPQLLECDYLIVGAGAAPLAFIDTMLTELPETKIILIDKKAAPGGHWVDAYGFVRLHQPSIVYGISSKQLEGNWLKVMIAEFMLPWKHRANKQQILTYFGDFVNEKVASQQVTFYPNCVYNFETNDEKHDSSTTTTTSTTSTDNNQDDGMRSFSSVDGSVTYKVKVNVKLINATDGECIIPCESPLQFPVDEEVRVMTPNQIYDVFQEDDDGCCNGRSLLLKKKKYIILGAGKTGMDCVVYLQKTMKVNPNDIAWVISNDVWMMSLEAGGDPGAWPRCLAKFDNDVDQASLALEKEGTFVRLDKSIMPSKFRFPVIPKDELKLLQNVKTVIRRGRATAIRRKSSSGGSNNAVMVEFGSEQSPWEAFAPIDECVFVHATSPGPFNGSGPNTTIFNSAKTMTLKLVFAPPISLSMSVVAKIEAARRNGTLDLDIMRRLVLALEEDKPGNNNNNNDKNFTENDLLNALVRPFITSFSSFQPMINLATIFAILDQDPMVGMNWMKQNRLCIFSYPDAGFKSETCDDIRMLRSKGNSLGLPENDIRMLEVLSEKLKPLEGM